ncbi:MAG: hypothetical protein GKR88_16080 [Flavobacteriaceae bacterium]|nr:MAG: hypothetical protein GKR88_16080 [Flavobacteriaceae bacterium]
MKKITFFLILLNLLSCEEPKKEEQHHLITPFEKSSGTETSEYKDVILYYTKLADTYREISLFEIGQTDSGKPLHLAVFNADGKINLGDFKSTQKNKLLINNGIHPGEPDGIDASMLMLRDIVQNDVLQKKYQNTLIAVIPVYNIGGALNRNSYTRANQNGPKAYGFRGNARNFDLNRDFIKQDTKNAAAFATIFHTINPDVFIDNHVSNGADYQYAISHLFTQHNKLGGNLGVFLETQMRPAMEVSLAKKGILITPYVNVWGSTPEKGFSQFFDSPRYSTGYTALFNTLGLMVETHMLKPYKIRVAQTYELMLSVLNFTEENSTAIKELRSKATQEILAKETYPITYQTDKESPTILQFKGYEGSYINSDVTTGKRLFYDRTKPYTKQVSYYNNFTVTKEIRIPKGYILRQSWHRIISRLENNQITYTRFKKDTIVEVEVQHIADYKTRTKTYEGHYLHYDTSVSTSNQKIHFTKGDIYISTNQKGIRYLLETLEASATDSFFNWNFFDTVLQQKEGYSSYVFEEIAAQFLKGHPKIKKRFDNKIKTDINFAGDPKAQLNFIYKKSPYYEKAHLMLPVFKVY